MSINGGADWRVDELTPELVRDGMLELERDIVSARNEIDQWGTRADIRLRNWENAFEARAILIARQAAEGAADKVTEKVFAAIGRLESRVQGVEGRAEKAEGRASQAELTAYQAKGAADASGQWAQVFASKKKESEAPISDDLKGAPLVVQKWFRRPGWIVVVAVAIGSAIAAGVEAFRAVVK